MHWERNQADLYAEGAGVGHNHRPQSPRAAQWQTPHLPHTPEPHHHHAGKEDLDLVETAFIESFAVTNDPTSFLRLAGIPFEAVGDNGARLVLLRIEIDAVTDIGTLTPHLGGASMRYDPLPARMVSQRRRLRFVFSDENSTPRILTLGEVRKLSGR